MIHAGIRELVAMKISGHKTRAIFDRCNIVDEKDLRIVSGKVFKMYHETSEEWGKSKIGTIPFLVSNEE